MNFVCIGDSITAGYPWSSEQSWPSILERRTGQRFYNLGASGETSAEIHQHLQTRLSACQSETALLCAGSNDFIFTDAAPCQVMNHLSAMADELKSTGITPVLWTPLLTIPIAAERIWSYGMNYQKVNRALSELRILILEACEKSDIPVIDTQSAYDQLIQRETSETPDPFFSAFYVDGLHPTQLGYEALADLLQSGLSSFLTK